MTSQEIREKFLEFFKTRGHKVVPSSSLIPDDLSVLFTTAGMQQFKPYYTGDADPMKDFGSLNTVSIQKSMRTSDIDEVGDESHLTFFEMLGNFSFGGYFKKEAIEWSHEFITKKMGLEIDYVSVFKEKPLDTARGKSGGIPPDLKSEKIWKSIDPNIKIKYSARADNFWGPTGKEGPCGPTTEIYVNGIEIWNIVFNEFYCLPAVALAKAGESNGSSSLEPLKTPGIDTGMGLERLAMVVQKKKNIFETDLFRPIIDEVNVLEKYDNARVRRIVTDHVRSIAFLVSDGVRPSNKEQGYVLRRLMRRIITYGANGEDLLKILANGENYKYYKTDFDSILEVWTEEKNRFSKTLERGLKELEKQKQIDVKTAFDLYQTYGLPYEIIKEVGGKKTSGLERKDFDKEFSKHQKISKAGQEKKFGGHGLILDTGELKAGSEKELKKVTRLHTATHLLQAALRQVLGPEVKQMGSDITSERTRFDFSFGRKLTPEELKTVEERVNEVINKDLNVKIEEMDYKEAVKKGALSFFKHKYPKRVKVYNIMDADKIISIELCGGPHVARTGEIGKFKIIKEEAVGSGARRIRAVVED